ncbi:MAG: DUF5615 family PIN-like protein [Chloroflexi bacterium]|nr:DUF5615 family PIN-like protein [Chloroflexota bacterium]
MDEDVPLQLGDLLRSRGLVVHLPPEVGAQSAADPVQLQKCTAKGWILITQNRRHFGRLHWLWMTFHSWGVLPSPHCGILTVYEQDPLLPEQLAPAISMLIEKQTTMRGTMWMWQSSRGQWKIQPVAFV